jgi:hypothetical protein
VGRLQIAQRFEKAVTPLVEKRGSIEATSLALLLGSGWWGGFGSMKGLGMGGYPGDQEDRKRHNRGGSHAGKSSLGIVLPARTISAGRRFRKINLGES